MRRSIRHLTMIMSCGLMAVIGLTAIVGPADGRVKQPEPQALSNAQLVEALHALQTTKNVLEEADHDYGGHRADAVRDVKAAIKQLRQALEWVHKNHKNTLPKSFNPKAKWTPEPQAISNFQLAESIKVLEKTETFLKQANHDYGGHRENAMHDIHAAVQQLRLALKFERKKEK